MKRGFIDEPVRDIQSMMGRTAKASEIQQGEFIILARLFLEMARPELALEILNPLLETASRKGHQRREIEILILQALALRQGGEEADALKTLGLALSYAEPQGYRRTFLDEGEQLAKLLYRAAVKGYSPSYCGKLLAGFSNELPTTTEASLSSPDEAYVETLTNRELGVLELIERGLSNREIAAELYISLSTVKGHTSSIIGKLGVSNRTQAVARARSLGILHTSDQ